ncbi:DUF5695 domain-containing protein [Rathayibacter sp. Leaf248]|uniref:DUF5695 domain-containing protein n=1 Tax=Rathayibacter sp. Leaf248 TaxID=2876555 RepID=UPI001E55EB85|nr:DUF5695 domain-containing protein [Rathayibacter sp. Leaf248]
MTRTTRLTRWASVGATALALLATSALHPVAADAATVYPYTLSSSQVNVGFAADGSLQSLKIPGDLYDTQYVANPDVAPKLAADPAAKNRQWLGNALFSYATGTGTPTASGVGTTPWKTAWTTESADARTVTATANSVTVKYQNSANANGVKGFTFTQTYSLDTDGSLLWKQTVTNTSGQRLVIGDWGIPIPDNELWNEGDEIYETRVLAHSYIGKNSSYVSIGRPSGQGPDLLLSSDSATGSGFEYLDRWRAEQYGDGPWVGSHANPKGLNVYYPHSMAIQKTGGGYLPSTALSLATGASKTYTFHIAKTTSDQDRQNVLYNQGSLDVGAVQPGMVVPYDQAAEVALRVKGTITGVTAKNSNDLGGSAPTNPTVALNRTNAGYSIYRLGFDRTQLGNNLVTVNYTDAAGNARSSVLQFFVIDKVGAVLSDHAAFTVGKQQWTAADGIGPSDMRFATYDDWMMNATDGSVPSAANPPQGRRNAYGGYWGLGDDWGLPRGTFLAAKNSVLPVAGEVKSLDTYLTKAVWENLMGNTPDDADPDYLIYNFWEQGKPGSLNTTPSYRGYAYPHIYNTFFGMYEIQKKYPSLISYAHPADWYLDAAYEIFRELYEGPVAYNWHTGLMGELSTPDLISALRAEGKNVEANDVETKMATKYTNFRSNKYPYGSEYSFDNTGEESVYTLARLQVEKDRDNSLRMMRDIIAKTTATRGQMPIWYWYADPTTITGPNWWQSQYSASLAGYTMDDYINHTSALETGSNAVTSSQRAVLQRLNYGGKLMNLANVNSGQISNHPANIGAAAWTYQSQKGVLGTEGVGGGANVQHLKGWRGMTGEADLGLWGALQTMSTDVVTDDPIFGTVAYGGSVTSDAYSTTVTPKDGVQQRLNMVTQQLSVDLGNDRYTSAIVGKNSADLRLDMANVSGTAHTGTVEVSGLAQGSYSVVVNGTSQGKVNNYSPAGALAAPLTVSYNAPAGADFIVHLVSTAPDANTAPTVNAGADQTGLKKGIDSIVLSGSASDDKLGNPNGSLSTTWSTQSAPAGATASFSSTSSLSPTVTVSTAGTYVFKLSATDGALTSTDTVSVTVNELQALPTDWVTYTFDSSSNGTVPDTSGNGNTLALKGTAATTTDSGRTVLRLDGAGGTYAQLPDNIVSRASTMTLSVTAKIDSADTWSRLFDFGANDQKYMFLTPKAGDGKVGFGITTSGGPNESKITTGYTMPVGTWTTFKLTFQPNSNGTTTGTLYANGTQIGQNTAMTVAPKDLGATRNDYFGKSQYGDPNLKGAIDQFEIHGDLR